MEEIIIDLISLARIHFDFFFFFLFFSKTSSLRYSCSFLANCTETFRVAKSFAGSIPPNEFSPFAKVWNHSCESENIFVASVTKRAEARINFQKFFTRDSYTQRSRRKKFIHSFRVEKNRRRRELSRRAIIRLTWMSMLLGPAIEFRSLSRPRSRLGFWIGVGEGD